MPKRKTASHKKQDSAAAAKKPRAAVAAAAEAQPADSDHIVVGSPKSVLARANLAQRIAVQTLKLADAIKKKGSSYTQRAQTMTDLLKTDADRSESLLDLSLVVEGESSCVLFQLLDFFDDCVRDGDETADVAADKDEAEALINHVTPLMQKLLRSFDPATVDAATGNNALHEMCRLFDLCGVSSWDYKLAELVIVGGVSVHARNKEGRTPLLEHAYTATTSMDSADGIRLLLQRGADLKAQDQDGNGVLHLLVENKATALLEDLFDGDDACPLDLLLRNMAGQTAADVAASQLEEQADGSADSPERRIHRLMAAQTAMWIKHAQPASRHHLQAAPQEADAAAANGAHSLQAALASAKLAPRIATQTLKLVDTIKRSVGSYTQRMQAVLDLLKEDADQSESLLDLSLAVEGEKSCVLFQLLHFFNDCIPDGDEADDVKADKDATEDLNMNVMRPLTKALLRSFDPATVDASTGNNALHEMCRLFSLESVSGWAQRLTELLISHSVSVHARNKKGRTPLLQWAASASSNDFSASGLRLLLVHGADLTVQDNKGNGVLHLLVQRKAANLLDNLFSADVAGNLDHALRNSKSQTAADLAAIQLAELEDADEDEDPEDEEEVSQRQQEEQRARRIHRLLAAQAAMWTKRVRPALLLCLETVLPVTDLAKLTLGYIDGSGRPFDKAAESESDEEAEQAAAAAAAQS